MGIFDKNHQGAVQRAHLSDAFGALRSDGGGPRQAPAALQALQQHQARQRAQEAMRAAQDGGGLPLGFNSPAFQAFAQENPEQALQLMAQKAITPAPKRETLKGADGYQYYPDTGERVLPGVTAPRTGWRDATPQELARYGAKAGQINEATGKFAPINPATGMRMESDGDGGFTFSQGPGVGQSNLTKKETNNQQSKLTTNIDLIGRMDRVGELAGINPETGVMDPDKARILTYRGQAEDWVTNVAEKAGIEPSEVAARAVADRTRFTTSVEQFAAPLGSWFGLNGQELNASLPGLGAFSGGVDFMQV